jgi:hypothetical protein
VLAEHGTLAPGEQVMIRAVSMEQHPEMSHVEVGHRVGLVGLFYETERNTYLLRWSGRVARD